jgi:type IV secretory pathway VirD2 relaxase
MGGKASNNFQSDRPESGGADRDELREKSGLLDREKQKFATEQARRQAAARDESAARAPDAIADEPDDPSPGSHER